MRILKFLTLLILLLAVVGLMSGCGVDATPAATPTGPVPVEAGSKIWTAGSSTVGPITIQAAQAYRQEINPDGEITVDILGTGGGFKKFCGGETDISNASRPINEEEAAACAENGVAYIELPVAFDGLAVLTNLNNDFVACLTTAELETMWAPEAEEVIVNWNQIRPEFPDKPLLLYGPGTESGSFDYFTEATVGEEGASRRDFLGSENDNILVDRIAEVESALGFFGLAYYDENRDRLKLLAIDDGHGCVEPNTETVARGLYQPLSRPLFIYINVAHIEAKPEISDFVTFYIANAARLVDEVGYIALTDRLYELARQRYEARQLGSVFEGGANVGVSLADLLEREQ